MQAFSINNKKWDDKFGVLEDNYTQRMKEQAAAEEAKIIEGVGADAEIVTNEKGGKQSKSPMAMHLVDPKFLETFAQDNADVLAWGNSEWKDENQELLFGCYKAIVHIAQYMQYGIKFKLQNAMTCLNCDTLLQVVSIAKILQYGAERYAPNNWRLIPEEEHINHALIHLVAHIAGDKQDDHINHALCRLMMAMATEKSKGFDYGRFVA